MDGDTWLAFGARDVMKGVFWVFIFIKKTFFPSYHFAPMFFSCHLLGKNYLQKRKKIPDLDFGPKRKKSS
jgi:hypothetical protein